jgi:hypothetical protein
MFILNLTPINRNIGGPNLNPVTGNQGKDPDGAFQQGMEGNGYDQGALEKAVSERTRLTRTKRAGHASKTKSKNSLFVVDDEDNLDEQPVYRTIMVDGNLFTLRLLAVA